MSKARIDRLITTLANTEDLPAFFAAEGITGEPWNADACPVANYVLRETNAREASVMNRVGYLARNGQWIWRNTPDNVIAFIRAFDKGQYPELIATEVDAE